MFGFPAIGLSTATLGQLLVFFFEFNLHIAIIVFNAKISLIFPNSKATGPFLQVEKNHCDQRERELESHTQITKNCGSNLLKQKEFQLNNCAASKMFSLHMHAPIMC